MKWICFLFLFVSAWAATAFCQVHSWLDKSGVRHYSSTPPENMKDVTEYKVLENLRERNEPDETVVSAEKNPYPDVVIYTTSWCPVCKKTKAWFNVKKVPYRELDVEKSQENYSAYKSQGGKEGVPFIVVGDNKMEGFDEGIMRNWLGMKK